MKHWKLFSSLYLYQCHKCFIPLLLTLGRVAPWHLMNLFFGNTPSSYINPNFMADFKKRVREHNYLNFTVSCEIKIAEDFYTINDPFQCRWKIPLVQSRKFHGYGKSSTMFRHELQAKESGKPVLQATQTNVFVDRKTRKGVPISNLFSDEHAHMQIAPAPPPRLCLPNKGIFSTEMRVNPSDIDGNQHCNMMVYIRFCHDAGALAVKQGRLWFCE